MMRRSQSAIEAYKRLRRESPSLPEATIGIGLNQPEVVLSLEQLTKRQADLASIALRKQVAMSDDIIIT